MERECLDLHVVRDAVCDIYLTLLPVLPVAAEQIVDSDECTASIGRLSLFARTGSKKMSPCSGEERDEKDSTVSYSPTRSTADAVGICHALISVSASSGFSCVATFVR